MNKLIAYSAHAKRQAKQIVHEQFDEVLCGSFNVPDFEQMEHFLKDVIVYDFDEYEETKKLTAIHPSWSESQLKDEVHRRKIRYEGEYQTNLSQASLEGINEVENLISSLRAALRAWKIKHLE